MREIDENELRQLYYEFKKSDARCASVLRDRENNVDYYQGHSVRHGLYKEIIADDMTDGFLMGFPHGNVIKQGKRTNFLRGENQIYPTSMPTLFRKLKELSNDEEKRIEMFVSDMRVFEFKNLLYLFKHVQMWEKNYSDVLFEPLAQHYGINTRWLDITNNFEVALFFACCYFDKRLNRWMPLTEKETQKSENTRYGVIFKQPYWQTDVDMIGRLVGENQTGYGNIILPIGFQPFMRCHMQNGYGIYMNEAYDLFENSSFEALKFKHNEAMSKFIFNEMDKGRKIYPHEGLTLVQDQIDDINNSKSFSQEAYEYALEKSGFTDDDIYQTLLSNGYLIDKSPIKLSRQRRRQIDRIYESFDLKKDYGITVRYRLSYTP